MLKIENLDVFYGNVQALNGVNIEIGRGELVALLGSNGAGKSTTLMSISGILKPRAGSIFYKDIEITSQSSQSIVQNGLVHCPEGRRIFGGLTVMENLRMGAMRRKDRSNLAPDLKRVFSLFPVLGERKNQSGSTLSGGEQQMLALGRSLMASPDLLLLDEPSLGLAPIIVESIFRVIRELHDEGVTILLVEQNARQALEIADRCYVLETGRVVMSGTGQELKANPKIENYYLGGSAE